MDDETKQKATNAAADLALAELLRCLIGDIYATQNAEDFKRQLAALEEKAVDRIQNGNCWPNASKEMNDFSITAAANWVGVILAGVRNPKTSD